MKLVTFRLGLDRISRSLKCPNNLLFKLVPEIKFCRIKDFVNLSETRIDKFSLSKPLLVMRVSYFHVLYLEFDAGKLLRIMEGIFGTVVPKQYLISGKLCYLACDL